MHIDDILIESMIAEAETSLVAKIRQLLSKGLSVAAVATALSVNPVAVQDVEAGSARVRTTTARDSLSIEEIIARTIEGEAEGESYEGKLAVASTIWNRAGGKWYLLKYIATQPSQYSIWNKGLPPKKPGPDSLAIAQHMLSGSFKPTTKHTHYFNPKKVKKTPRWAKGVPFETIENHRFLTPRRG